MSEQELVDHIRRRLLAAGTGNYLDTKVWVDDIVEIFPHISRQEIENHLRAEARKMGVSVP